MLMYNGIFYILIVIEVVEVSEYLVALTTDEMSFCLFLSRE